jgi:DNA mismatch endonuclease (patch repair protein)
VPSAAGSANAPEPLGGGLPQVPSDPRSPAASSAATRRVMQGNRGRDTQPEIQLRAQLHRRGLRFRKHAAPLPGLRCDADVVLSRARIAIFVDGCFWHGCAEHGRTPRANASYWTAKIERNKQRDRRNNELLAAAGWLVLRYWEHDDPEVAAVEVARAHAARTRQASRDLTS